MQTREIEKYHPTERAIAGIFCVKSQKGGTLASAWYDASRWPDGAEDRRNVCVMDRKNPECCREISEPEKVACAHSFRWINYTSSSLTYQLHNIKPWQRLVRENKGKRRTKLVCSAGTTVIYRRRLAVYGKTSVAVLPRIPSAIAPHSRELVVGPLVLTFHDVRFPFFSPLLRLRFNNNNSTARFIVANYSSLRVCDTTNIYRLLNDDGYLPISCALHKV